MNRAYAFPFLQSTITSRNNKVSPLQMLSRPELLFSPKTGLLYSHTKKKIKPDYLFLDMKNL